MINVLIVDDDKLVRKGLISVMPWHMFEMKVVGEAANGEKALELLDNSHVHLLITDLSMPVMSGIELIRIARKKYPNLAIAVLTMHQDFEFIQEALRLGAIDYIAKVQLEKEQFEEVLARIYARIIDERVKKQEMHSVADIYTIDTAYALLSLKDKPDINKEAGDATRLEWRMTHNDQIMLWPAKEDVFEACDEELPRLPAGIHRQEWKLVKLQGLRGILRSEVEQWLRQYREKMLFYECDGSEGYLIEKSIAELQMEDMEPHQAEIERMRQGLHSFHWIHDELCFRGLQLQLKQLQLSVPKLMQLLYGFTVDWNRLFRAITQVDTALPSEFLCWKEVSDWLLCFREQTLKQLGKLEINRDVSGSIMSAIKIVHDEYELPLFAIDVAKRVNLSRSYFNECFKKIIGYSFNEYLRKVRIDKARDYLTQTMKPIVWIAEHTGYADEKYFSRVFREQTGMLPSEYRQHHRRR